MVGASVEAGGDGCIAVRCSDTPQVRPYHPLRQAGAGGWLEMTSWTNDGVIRQASLQEVRERTDKSFRPDWINLAE